MLTRYIIYYALNLKDNSCIFQKNIGQSNHKFVDLSQLLINFIQKFLDINAEEIFFNHINKMLNQGRCRRHPEQIIDTICFHKNCRDEHSQVMCSYCAYADPNHKDHLSFIEPLHVASRTFKIVSEITSQTNSKLLSESQYQIKDSREFLMNMFNKTVGKQLERLKCLHNFLQKEAFLNICEKIRKDPKQHSKCCLPIINLMRDLDQNDKRCTKRKINMLIEDEILKMSNNFIQKLQEVKTSIFEVIKNAFEDDPIFQQEINSENIIKRVKKQYYSSPKKHQIENQQKITIRKPQKWMKQKPIKKKQPQKNHIPKRKSTQSKKQPNEKIQKVVFAPLIYENIDSPINKILEYDSNTDSDNNQQQQISNQTLSSSSEVKSINMECLQLISPRGTDMKAQLFIVWDVGHNKSQILRYLCSNKSLRHLMIEDKLLANSKDIFYIIKNMPWLKGLYFCCENEVNQQIVKQCQLQYLSPLPSYRFIKEIDINKYFPRNSPSIELQQVTEQFTIQTSKKSIKNVYVSCYNLETIGLQTEEINFVRFRKSLSWQFENFHSLHLLRCINLQILVFSNIFIKNNVNLRKIYVGCGQLHTIVIDNCRADHNELIQQFSALRKEQIKHLKVSGELLFPKIILNSQSVKQICRHKKLQTLILTNIQFFTLQGERNSKNLMDFSSLQELEHLNLFGSEPIYSDLVLYLNPKCKQNLKVLNLGCSQINKEVVPHLKQFVNLEALSIQYTALGDDEIKEIVENMNKLQFIGLESLNGTVVVYEQKELNNNEQYYGVVSSKSLIGCQELKYANIYGCNMLQNYDWTKQEKLQCLRVSNGILSEIVANSLRERGIKVIIQCMNWSQQSINKKMNKYHKTIDNGIAHQTKKRASKQQKFLTKKRKRPNPNFTLISHQKELKYQVNSFNPKINANQSSQQPIHLMLDDQQIQNYDKGQHKEILNNHPIQTIVVQDQQFS